ncbi:hypothetical protein ACWD33_27135 [Streptomyces xiamenensis]|uniref:hypothetical protein n=1 Tax=Streptomyces sp. NRRL F-2890 TaxID=1463845 RepID=UPI0004C4C558|nr:hypothetical protein [Streptomyces sp. NRRL F-2890]
MPEANRLPHNTLQTLGFLLLGAVGFAAAQGWWLVVGLWFVFPAAAQVRQRRMLVRHQRDVRHIREDLVRFAAARVPARHTAHLHIAGGHRAVIVSGGANPRFVRVVLEGLPTAPAPVGEKAGSLRALITAYTIDERTGTVLAEAATVPVVRDPGSPGGVRIPRPSAPSRDRSLAGQWGVRARRALAGPAELQDLYAFLESADTVEINADSGEPDRP